MPGIIGFLLPMSGKDDILLNVAVCAAAIGYVLMMVSHIVLRRREPDMPRPYRTPGGAITTGVALVIALVAVVATFLVDVVAALCCVGAIAVFMLYLVLYSASNSSRFPTKSSRPSPRPRRNSNSPAAPRAFPRFPPGLAGRESPSRRPLLTAYKREMGARHPWQGAKRSPIQHPVRTSPSGGRFDTARHFVPHRLDGRL
ncbi:MAG: hypothetical protein R2768_03040 [Gordonia sp. (in: high G+C Gram-positive bacteria)]